MSRSNAAPASSGDPIPRDVRALPSAPSLEYERKEAKALLKHIHSGEIEALRRLGSAHPVALRDRQPHELQLADAQHVIAREYGFTSWPRLVEYFEELERHRNAPRHNSSDDGCDRFAERAKGIVRRHQRGDEFVARQLAHFVPRFYARSTAEILATPITEDEARLVVAREKRRASWAELIERANASRVRRERQTWRDGSAPFERARQAILDHDAGALATILDETPRFSRHRSSSVNGARHSARSLSGSRARRSRRRRDKSRTYSRLAVSTFSSSSTNDCTPGRWIGETRMPCVGI
jgi:hypothetical protein